MWVPLFTGIAAAVGLIAFLPKGERLARASHVAQPAEQAEGQLSSSDADLSSGRPAQRAPLPPGAVDLDELRARKATIRNSVDAVVLLSILFAAAYVIQVDYGWQPMSLVAGYFPREAQVVMDVWQGIQQAKGDVLQWIRRTRQAYGAQSAPLPRHML